MVLLLVLEPIVNFPENVSVSPVAVSVRSDRPSVSVVEVTSTFSVPEVIVTVLSNGMSKSPFISTRLFVDLVVPPKTPSSTPVSFNLRVAVSPVLVAVIETMTCSLVAESLFEC